MKNWTKNTTAEGPDIFEYGDGNGELLYRLYCLENEDSIEDRTPLILFYGDSVSPNPSLRDIIAFIDRECCFECDVVVCSVSKKSSNPDGEDVLYSNDSCSWKIL